MTVWPLVALLGAGSAFLFYASASKAGGCTGPDPTGNTYKAYSLEEMRLLAPKAKFYSGQFNGTEIWYIVGKTEENQVVFAVYVRYSDCRYRAVWAGTTKHNGTEMNTTFGSPVVNEVYTALNSHIQHFINIG